MRSPESKVTIKREHGRMGRSKKERQEQLQFMKTTFMHFVFNNPEARDTGLFVCPPWPIHKDDNAHGCGHFSTACPDHICNCGNHLRWVCPDCFGNFTASYRSKHRHDKEPLGSRRKLGNRKHGKPDSISKHDITSINASPNSAISTNIPASPTSDSPSASPVSSPMSPSTPPTIPPALPAIPVTPTATITPIAPPIVTTSPPTHSSSVTVYNPPASTYSPPAPTAYSSPGPSYSSPGPSYSSPGPSYSSPGPSYSSTSSSYTSPMSAYTSPAPVYSSPSASSYSPPIYSASIYSPPPSSINSYNSPLSQWNDNIIMLNNSSNSNNSLNILHKSYDDIFNNGLSSLHNVAPLSNSTPNLPSMPKSTTAYDSPAPIKFSQLLKWYKIENKEDTLPATILPVDSKAIRG